MGGLKDLSRLLPAAAAVPPGGRRWRPSSSSRVQRGACRGLHTPFCDSGRPWGVPGGGGVSVQYAGLPGARRQVSLAAGPQCQAGLPASPVTPVSMCQILRPSMSHVCKVSIVFTNVRSLLN